MPVKKGDLVEYTDHWYLVYPPPDAVGVIKFGVATRDEDRNGVLVEQADGTIERANEIHAYGWAGWVPDGLEPVMAKYDRYPAKWDEDYDKNFEEGY